MSLHFSNDSAASSGAGEPHGLSKLSNRKAKMEWDRAWFDQYLKGPSK